MKKMALASLFVISLFLLFSTPGYGQLELYTALPPFVSRGLQPNVMLLIDNSISMTRFAYFDGWNTTTTEDDNWGLTEAFPCTDFNPGFKYYGYFNPDSWYSYNTNHFVSTMAKTSRAKAASEWDGNFLNWLTMRRTDVLRKVLVGGIVAGGDLIGQNPIGTEDVAGAYKGIAAPTAGNYMDSSLLTAVSGVSPVQIVIKVWSQGNTAAISEIIGIGAHQSRTSRVTLNIAAYVGTQPNGVVQLVGDRVRWGITFFAADTRLGGVVRASIASINASAVYNEIQNTSPSVQHTPLADSLWSVTGYFAQRDTIPDFGGPGPNYQNNYTVNLNTDPLNYGTGGNPNFAWCGQNFVILITDGEPCSDGHLPGSLANWAHGRSEYNCDARSPDLGTDCYFPPCALGGCVPGIEDVALYSHVSDLRPDLESKQNLDLYVVYAFGSGSKILEYAAINGGFDDDNNNGRPDGPEEWDKDDDDVPDHYFQAYDGYRLEQSLILAITDILRKVASGTAVSVLATSATGEGSLFQAFFRPSMAEGTREVKWLGYLQGLWVDRFGHLREDTTNDHRLAYAQDKIIKFAIGPGGDTMVEKYRDSDGNGFADSTTPDALVALSEMIPLWEAGELLALRDPSSRAITTFVDSDNDGRVDSGEVIDFLPSERTLLRPYLRAADPTEAQNIINFIRGEQVAGYRDRELTVAGQAGQVWKLGDIVYSTPTVVGKPESNFNFIYSDDTYAPYYERYKDRDVVVYVGANDGMLHAFWAGKYHEGDDSSTGSIQEAGWYSTESGIGTTQGEELWAYIPYNLLPHLKWLTDNNYSHVYYVDLKPRVVDARIFTPDTDHPNGWGTVLIGGMRLGGGKVDVTDTFGTTSETRTFRSAYFAFDVTIPQSPRLLWESTDPGLGFTTSYPTVAKINNQYFLIFGSGPTDYNGGSSQPGKIFVVDLATGGNGVRKIFNCDANASLTDPIAVDVTMDYSIDVLYLGESMTSGATLSGKVYRLCTKVDGNYSDNPNNWTISTLFATESGQPITSGAGSSIDEHGNLWVYFGTGKYMSTDDRLTVPMQSFYGVKDPCHQGDCTTTVLKTDLFNSTSVVIAEAGGVTGAGGTVTNWDTLTQAVDNTSGWYVDLFANGHDPSERVLSKPGILGGIVFFTTFTPNSDICGFGGEGRLYALNFVTGTANRHSVIGTEGGAVSGSRDLGAGVPSRLAIHEGQEEGGATGYIQTSTGAVEQVELILPPEMRPGIISWREIR